MTGATRRITCAGLLLTASALCGASTVISAEREHGESALAKLAEAMKPGSWEELKTEMPQNLWRSPLVDGGRNNGGSGGLHIAGWTDDAHWDSKTGQFLYMGLRQTRQFIAYSEAKNAWRVIKLDRSSDNPCFQSRFGHIYSSNGFDPQRSRFYHRYNSYTNKQKSIDLTGGISYFDAATERWTKLPPIPPNTTFTGMAIEYFGAMDGVVILGKDAWFFSTKRQKWENLGPCPVDGYHSLIRHNPFRNEVLMAGGNHNPRAVARLKSDGKIEQLKDFPTNIGVQSDKITIDPATGKYLILAGNKNEPKQLYEFDSDNNEYLPVEAFMAGWPFSRYDMPVCAFIPEHGVTMWADTRGTFLYKHAPAKAVPAKSGPDKAAAADPPGIRCQVVRLEGAFLSGAEAKRTPLSAPVHIFRGRIEPFLNPKAKHPALMKIVKADAAGRFEVSLPPGEYTLVAELNGELYLNNFLEDGNWATTTVAPGKWRDYVIEDVSSRDQ